MIRSLDLFQLPDLILMEVKLALGAFFFVLFISLHFLKLHIGSKLLFCIFVNIYLGQFSGGGPNS